MLTTLKFISPAIARQYNIAEVIHSGPGDFIIILYHKDIEYPAVYAKIKYIENYDKTYAIFEASALGEEFALAYASREALESGLVMISEEILKCMCAKTATIKT